MTCEELSALAQASGFTAWAPLDTATIELKPQVRDMCAANTCGQYGKRWSCPPGCGRLEECAEKLRPFPGGILVQTCGSIEDSFDFEAMQQVEDLHKAHFSKMQDALLKKGIRFLALGAGCCTLCPNCTYPDAPCRFPDRAVASMEAFGMVVLEVCRANGLPYYYGADKIAYTGCFLIEGGIP
jgi:predicted metal-binding protein